MRTATLLAAISLSCCLTSCAHNVDRAENRPEALDSPESFGVNECSTVDPQAVSLKEMLFTNVSLSRGVTVTLAGNEKAQGALYESTNRERILLITDASDGLKMYTDHKTYQKLDPRYQKGGEGLYTFETDIPSSLKKYEAASEQCFQQKYGSLGSAKPQAVSAKNDGLMDNCSLAGDSLLKSLKGTYPNLTLVKGFIYSQIVDNDPDKGSIGIQYYWTSSNEILRSVIDNTRGETTIFVDDKYLNEVDSKVDYKSPIPGKYSKYLKDADTCFSKLGQR